MQMVFNNVMKVYILSNCDQSSTSVFVNAPLASAFFSVNFINIIIIAELKSNGVLGNGKVNNVDVVQFVEHFLSSMHDIGINIGFQRHYSAEWLKAGFYSTACSDDESIKFSSSNQIAQGKDANETLSSFVDLIENLHQILRILA